ncbi:hypothetical protein EV294_102732 [Paenibacillus sp. BK033]|nr:hypothetical protein EV294_102732 [Paenibacillus sp. BK033]
MVPLEPNLHGASQNVAPNTGSTYGRLILFDWLHQPYLCFSMKDAKLPHNSISINFRGSAFFLKVLFWVCFIMLFFRF